MLGNRSQHEQESILFTGKLFQQWKTHFLRYVDNISMPNSIRTKYTRKYPNKWRKLIKWAVLNERLDYTSTTKYLFDDDVNCYETFKFDSKWGTGCRYQLPIFHHRSRTPMKANKGKFNKSRSFGKGGFRGISLGKKITQLKRRKKAGRTRKRISKLETNARCKLNEQREERRGNGAGKRKKNQLSWEQKVL